MNLDLAPVLARVFAGFTVGQCRSFGRDDDSGNAITGKAIFPFLEKNGLFEKRAGGRDAAGEQQDDQGGWQEVFRESFHLALAQRRPHGERRR